MKKIMLDAGHGLNTAGKRTPDGIKEFTLNKKVVDYIVECLKGYDVEIRYSHDHSGAVDVSLADRVKSCNAYKPDVFVSIHHNALNGSWGSHGGVEVYAHSQGTNDDRAVASKVVNALAKETSLKNRGVKSEAFAVLTCNATAILCEGGFMDSTVDYPVITSANGQKAYAKAVSDSLISYLGLKLKTPPAMSATVVQQSNVCPTCGQAVNVSLTTNNAVGYVVAKGETLYGIAKANGTTVEALKKINNLSSDVLKVGQVLKLK